MCSGLFLVKSVQLTNVRGIKNYGYLLSIAHFDFSRWDDELLLDDNFYVLSITPEFRFYFNPDYDADGYFISAYLKYRTFLSSIEELDYSGSSYGLSLGFGFGRKWIFKQNFLIEGYLGIGRELAEFGLISVDGRAGITLGWRFSH